MVTIPKKFIKSGLEPTEFSRNLVRKLDGAKHTVPVSSLERHPSSDLFEISGHMDNQKFWDDPKNMATHLRGEYLAVGGDYSKMAKYTDKYGIEYAKIELPDNNCLKVCQNEEGTFTYIYESFPDRCATLDANNKVVHAVVGDGNSATTYSREKGKHVISDEWDGYSYRKTVYEEDGFTKNSVRENQNLDIAAKSGTVTYYSPEGQITKKYTYDKDVCCGLPKMENLRTIEQYKDGKPSHVIHLAPNVDGELAVTKAGKLDLDGNIIE